MLLIRLSLKTNPYRDDLITFRFYTGTLKICFIWQGFLQAQVLYHNFVSLRVPRSIVAILGLHFSAETSDFYTWNLLEALQR